MEKNSQQLKLNERTFADNSKLDGVTYDTRATAALLGITAAQLDTLVRHAALVPCNAPPNGARKFYRRFTAPAIEAARPRIAEILHPAPSRQPKATDDDVIARLERIEAAVNTLVQALTK